MKIVKIGGFLIAASIAATCLAQHEPAAHAAAPSAEGHADHTMPYPHPTLPDNEQVWAGIMVMVIGAMFVLAPIVAFIRDTEMLPEEAPDPHASHAHDDHGAHH